MLSTNSIEIIDFNLNIRLTLSNIDDKHILPKQITQIIEN